VWKVVKNKADKARTTEAKEERKKEKRV